MREKFRGYYKPTEAEEDMMWASAHIIMDTNVVLDLYKYHAKTTDLYLRSLRVYKDQLWLPYQVALEFHKNRPKVRAETTKGHKDRISDLKAIKNKIQLNTPKSKLETSTVENELVAKTDEAILALEAELKQLVAETHVNSRDHLLDHITELFDGGVGDAPTPERLAELIDVAKQRFDDLVPPGYEDRKRKPPGEEYGDFLLWRQAMDYAKAQGKDIIIATEDNKSDWWQKINGDEIIGPRPELVQEFRSETGQEIIFYSGRDFFRQLSDRAQITQSSEDLAGALADVTSVSDERSAAEVARAAAEFESLLRRSRESLAEHELARRNQADARDRLRTAAEEEESALRDRLSQLAMHEYELREQLAVIAVASREDSEVNRNDLLGRASDAHQRLMEIHATRNKLGDRLAEIEASIGGVRREREIREDAAARIARNTERHLKWREYVLEDETPDK